MTTRTITTAAVAEGPSVAGGYVGLTMVRQWRAITAGGTLSFPKALRRRSPADKAQPDNRMPDGFIALAEGSSTAEPLRSREVSCGHIYS